MTLTKVGLLEYQCGMARKTSAVVLTLLVGCAHQAPPVPPAPAVDWEQRARTACDSLQKTTLRAPIRTDVAEALQRIAAARAAGDGSQAQTLAAQLADQCTDETERRNALGPLLEMVDQDRDRVTPASRALLARLLARADYSGAMLCAEALLEGSPARCPAPSGFAPRLRDQPPADVTPPVAVPPSSTTAVASPAVAPPPDRSAAPPAASPPAMVNQARAGEHELQLPPSQVLFPMMVGVLDSHVDFQLGSSWYSTHDVSNKWLLLGLDARIAIRDRLEVGIMLPMASAFVSAGGTSTASTYFGSMALNLKIKVAGRSEGPFAVSLFFNTHLPTSTGNLDLFLPIPRLGMGGGRDFAILHTGGAASLGLGPVTLMGGVGLLDLVDGSFEDRVLLLFDAAAAWRAHRMLAPYLGFHLLGGAYPADSGTGVALSLGLRVLPWSALHLDLGARIGLNDPSGTLFNGGGRAMILFAAGYRFRL